MDEIVHFIYELPFRARKELCRILDADGRWEELGGIYMNIDVTTLTLIGQAIYCEKSPTNQLLHKWGERMGTVAQLFLMLAKMDHQRGMTVLQHYVDPRYHILLRHDEREPLFSSGKMKSPNENQLPRPSLPSFSAMASKKEEVSTLNIPTADHSINLPIHKSSKFQGDYVNLNKVGGEEKNDNSFASKNCKAEFSINASGAQAKLSDLNLSNENNWDYESINKLSISKTNTPKKQHNISVMKESEAMQKQLFGASCVEKSGNSQSQGLNNLSSLETTLAPSLRISYTEILKATNDFSPVGVLGKGGFGIVYKGEWKKLCVAIKRLMPREKQYSASSLDLSLKQSLNELNILLSHPFDNILSVYGISLDGPEPCLVYQYMPNGSLEDRLLLKNNSSPLTWSQRSKIAEGSAKGLNHLHTAPGRPLVHGDIKSANILLDANFEPKIGDFGLAREGPNSQDTHVKVTTVHGTQVYLPPEYLRSHHLSPMVDVYSYGIVLLEIATGLRPFDDKREGTKHLVDYVKKHISSGNLDLLRDPKAGEEGVMWFREFIELGKKCIARSKKERPEVIEVLEMIQKIKEELSIIERVRRLSEDKEKICPFALSPTDLQKYYDLCNKYGVRSSNNAENSFKPDFSEVGSSSASSTLSPSQIRFPVNSNYTETDEFSCPSNYQISNLSSCSVSTEDTKLVVSSFQPSSIAEESASSIQTVVNESYGTAPLPLLTVLNASPAQLSNDAITDVPSFTSNLQSVTITNNELPSNIVLSSTSSAINSN